MMDGGGQADGRLTCWRCLRGGFGGFGDFYMFHVMGVSSQFEREEGMRGCLCCLKIGEGTMYSRGVYLLLDIRVTGIIEEV